ncbi:TlyA family RNA methyltransferase [Elusimicrobiota bacterium]
MAKAQQKKDRLDRIVVERNLAKDIAKAQAIIMAGRVLVDSITITKPGTPIKKTSNIEIKKTNPYVSRGGLKLESAMNVFKISCKGKVCMDIGSSTGGFTDYMLQHGAKKVYAVDVGKNLLDYKLINDPRVVNIENTNFRYFSSEILKENIEFVTIDVSFISLEKILPVAAKNIALGGSIVAMVKPQFEALSKETVKGVVKDESLRSKIIEKIKQFAINLGLEIKGSTDSGVKGPEGNIEHFLWLHKIK